MSSILDALKKVEQQSAGDGEVHPPLSVLLADRVADRQRKRRWWSAIAGVVVLAGALVVVFWLTRSPERGRPPAMAQRVEAPADTIPQKQTPAAEPPATTTRPPAAKSPIQRATRPLSRPPDEAVPATSSPAVSSTAASTRKPAIEQSRRKTLPREPEPMTPPPAVVNRPPVATATESRPPAPPTTDDSTAYRSDPRIDLQALVWAPEAADRFVVINNHLIKEGGAIDRIVVVKINPDDVLLSEGDDRWHQKFNIR